MTLAAILARHRGESVPVVPVSARPAGTTQSQEGRAVPVVPAVPALIDRDESALIQAMRARLFELAERQGTAAELVERLPALDVAACHGMPDDLLLGYLGMVDRKAVMDAGRRPTQYTRAVRCDGCGPVWLWPGVPTQLKGCPWCSRRMAGIAFERPDMEAYR